MLHLIVFLLTFLHSVVFINSVCDDYVVYWRIILYLTVFQLYTVHLYLSVSRSIDVTVVPPFLPVKIWSRVFHPRTFHGPPFSIPAFSASPCRERKQGEHHRRENGSDVGQTSLSLEDYYYRPTYKHIDFTAMYFRSNISFLTSAVLVLRCRPQTSLLNY